MCVETDLLPLPRLLSLAVHELRTPVTVVSGYLRMLLREQGGPLSERQRKMLEEAERSCARLTEIVAEMSDVGKLDAGDTKVEQQDVDVAGLLAEVASGMHEGEDRGIRVEVRGTENPVLVSGDRRRLAAALTALLHAALRERGEPGVVVANCSIVRGSSGGYAVLAVADESLLSDVTRDDAVEQFSFDEFRGGTGFRLPLARRVIERHGGAVWSAATDQELKALDAELRSNEHRLSDAQRSDYKRKRSTAALRLPLRT